MREPVTSYSLTHPRDLLGIVPYLLGFHPAGDVVALFQQPDHQLRRGARVSLQHTTGDIACALRDAAHRAGDVACAWLIGYGTIHDRDKITAIAQVVDTAVPVTGQFLVTDSHCYCVVRGCSCAASSGLPFDARSTAVAATMTVDGVVALPSCDDVIALVDPDIQAQNAVAAAIDDLQPSRETASLQVPRLMAAAQTGARLTDHEAARLAVALSDPAAARTAWIATGTDMWQRDLWLDMTRRIPAGHVAPAAGLAAWCAWRSGQTDLAVAALRRAQHADTLSSLTMIMEQVLRSRVKPEDIPWPLPADIRQAGHSDD